MRTWILICQPQSSWSFLGLTWVSFEGHGKVIPFSFYPSFQTAHVLQDYSLFTNIAWWSLGNENNKEPGSQTLQPDGSYIPWCLLDPFFSRIWRNQYWFMFGVERTTTDWYIGSSSCMDTAIKVKEDAGCQLGCREEPSFVNNFTPSS